MGHVQRGYIYEASGWFFVCYNVTEIIDGQPKRVQRSHRLCAKGGKHYARDCKAVKLLRDEFMLKINQGQQTTLVYQQNMRIADFWEHRYLPYLEEVVTLTGKPRKKPSTVSGYKQIWNQHLKAHFGNTTLREYEPFMGTQFLQTLTSTQGKVTIKHIKALGSALFKHALVKQQIKVNPWHDVEIPDDAIDSARTEHYTLEEAENLVSALVDHVDCQLVIALSCFLGLRPGEIAALKWEDFDSKSVHIRRSVVRGKVDVPKTPESLASLPLIAQVGVPPHLWRKESGDPKDGWFFPSRDNTPVDLHNLIARVIVPHVEGSDRCIRCDVTPEASPVEWKSLYAGRRGACTAVVEATGGNYAVAQTLLRHKSMKTTLDVYKKQITPAAFADGMKLLEAAAKKTKGEK